MSYARTAVVLVLGCLCVKPMHAQGDACQQRTIPVTVETKDGAPAPELSSADLQGTYRNQPVHVSLVTLDQRLPRIILLLDTSGSMQQTLNQSLDLAEDLLSKIPAAAEVGLAFFARDFQPIALPTTDREKLKSQLEALRKDSNSFKGKTALWASALQSVKMLGNPQVGDAIYVISDGGDNASNSKEASVAVTLAHSGVRMFAVAFHTGEPMVRPAPEEATGQIGMQQIIEDTGGTGIPFARQYIGHFPMPDFTALHDKSGQPTQFGLAMHEQYWRIFNFYRADIELPEAVDKPREWKLALAGLNKSQRDNLVLRYPHMLVPCH
jgi:hypothetical protein